MDGSGTSSIVDINAVREYLVRQDAVYDQIFDADVDSYLEDPIHRDAMQLGYIKIKPEAGPGIFHYVVLTDMGRVVAGLPKRWNAISCFVGVFRFVTGKRHTPTQPPRQT